MLIYLSSFYSVLWFWILSKIYWILFIFCEKSTVWHLMYLHNLTEIQHIDTCTHLCPHFSHACKEVLFCISCVFYICFLFVSQDSILMLVNLGHSSVLFVLILSLSSYDLLFVRSFYPCLSAVLDLFFYVIFLLNQIYEEVFLFDLCLNLVFSARFRLALSVFYLI